jgi:LPXTG-site transpeptidase (sortase) family protein
MDMMRRRLLALALVVSTLTAVWLAAQPSAGDVPRVAALPAGAPSIADTLHYIGRDSASGLPVPVNDRFISENALAIDRYGKDEREAVPPPPLSGVDIATLAIPALDVSAPLARFGLDRFGRLDVPQDRVTIGWHPAYSTLPGEGGATFVAAHYEYLGVPGVFFHLSSLAPGDDILVSTSDGSVHRYRVTSTIEYALATIDMGALLKGREGSESLTLMTCSGPANEGEYAFRTVVLAERVEA